jgi:uncharacterized HAD superfamily protein
MRIFVDIDNTLADLLIPMINLHYKWNGEFYDVEDIFSHELSEVFKCSHSEIWKLVHHSIISELPKPIKGASEAMTRLIKDNELHILTARDIAYKDFTIQWLNHNLIPYTTITFDHDKVKYAKDMDYLIDDLGSNALALSEAGVKVLMPDMPYNRDVIHKNITRVYSWKDILSKLGV